jgi:hypothetical protein
VKNKNGRERVLGCRELCMYRDEFGDHIIQGYKNSSSSSITPSSSSSSSS